MSKHQDSGRAGKAAGALLLGLLLLAASSAQAAGGVLVVRSQDLPPYAAVDQAFSASIGQSVSRITLGEAAPDALSRAMAGRPALVLALGQEAARSVTALEPAVPVLCALVPFPAKVPGRLVAVPMYASPQRQARLLKQALPGVKRVGLVYSPTNSRAAADAYGQAASAAGLVPVRYEVAGLRDFAGAVRRLVGRVDALWLIPDPTLINAETFKFLVQTSFESKLPLVAYSQAMVKAGALLALEPEYADMGRRAGSAGRRLLAGDGAVTPEPADGTLYVNRRSAGLLGVSLPEAVRAQAAQVFE
ncbi:MAG TPA: ABC transporter substrate binding protein [Aggregicoccus sp.]|nr:ABC transporter substrate binding protein [Aggregicoccus sp.]